VLFDLSGIISPRLTFDVFCRLQDIVDVGFPHLLLLRHPLTAATTTLPFQDGEKDLRAIFKIETKDEFCVSLTFPLKPSHLGTAGKQHMPAGGGD
jgi:hypothetical protein